MIEWLGKCFRLLPLDNNEMVFHWQPLLNIRLLKLKWWCDIRILLTGSQQHGQHVLYCITCLALVQERYITGCRPYMLSQGLQHHRGHGCTRQQSLEQNCIGVCKRSNFNMLLREWCNVNICSSCWKLEWFSYSLLAPKRYFEGESRDPHCKLAGLVYSLPH